MNNNINCGINFGAKPYTTINGRDNIIKKIAPKIRLKTIKTLGELHINRSNLGGGSKHYIEIELRQDGYCSGYITKAHKYLSIPEKEQTPEVLDNIAERFANTCKALCAENQYRKAVDEITGQIREEAKTIKRISSEKETAKYFKLDSMLKRLSASEEISRKKIAELDTKIKVLYDKFLEKLDNINEEGINLDAYKNFVATDITP